MVKVTDLANVPPPEQTSPVGLGKVPAASGPGRTVAVSDRAASVMSGCAYPVYLACYPSEGKSPRVFSAARFVL
ncbi:unannotated protein [freshwater metagenome]|uniref:Unannotated protein n=1 Tax=freshwater metagenome TaxID=449393 RepID=A0A6J7EVA2_9ZZZZ